MTYIPMHPQTPHALARAVYLADVYAPATKAEMEVHRQLVDGIRAGNLYRVIDAMKAAGTTGHRGLSTREWSEWATTWLAKVENLILADVEVKRAA